MKIDYFAFGSNLSSPRLRHRLPQVEVKTVATLARHRLCWHKNDRGQSGKCDIAFTGNTGDLVYGVVYRVSPAERLELDVIESNGYGYQRRDIRVMSLDGDRLDVFTYYAIDIDRDQQPFHWYKEHVLRGAIEHDFPPHYVEQIRATASIDDHDFERHQRELSIYPESL